MENSVFKKIFQAISRNCIVSSGCNMSAHKWNEHESHTAVLPITSSRSLQNGFKLSEMLPKIQTVGILFLLLSYLDYEKKNNDGV